MRWNSRTKNFTIILKKFKKLLKNALQSLQYYV